MQNVLSLHFQSAEVDKALPEEPKYHSVRKAKGIIERGHNINSIIFSVSLITFFN